MPKGKQQNAHMDPARIRQLLAVEAAATRFLNAYEDADAVGEQVARRELREAMDSRGSPGVQPCASLEECQGNTRLDCLRQGCEKWRAASGVSASDGETARAAMTSTTAKE